MTDNIKFENFKCELEIKKAYSEMIWKVIQKKFLYWIVVGNHKIDEDT